MLVALLLCVIAVVGAAPPQRARAFGTCVEMCSVGVASSCQSGYECRSNGCGHTCHKIASPLTGLNPFNSKCMPVLCAQYCPNGVILNADGCSTCKCKTLVG